jgi:CDP-glucose 4,6-dehydratase
LVPSSSINGSRVLITGHTGFKGSWLAQYLKSRNVEIFGLSLTPEKNSLYTKLDNSFYAREFIEDIRVLGKLRSVIQDIQPEYIFHLAAQPLVLRSYENPIETFHTNVLGTANLLESSINLKSVKRIVVATTDKVYKNFEDGRKYIETDALEGNDPYSASKVGAEAVVKAWQTLTSSVQSKSIISVRSGNVIGGGDFASQRLLPDIIRSFLSGEPVNVRNPSSTRPWQHVLDPIVGYVMAAEANNESKQLTAFNFGPSGDSLSVAEVCSIAKSTLDFNIEFKDPSPSKAHEANLLDLDSTRARQELMWKNVWTQHEAVLSTINWWKSVLSQEMSADDACKRDLDLMGTLRGLS